MSTSLDCVRCGATVKVRPKGMTFNDDFIYDFFCDDCFSKGYAGVTNPRQASLARLNWENEAVSRVKYKTITSYMLVMLSCEISCIECPLRKECYSKDFFYDVNKDLLRAERKKKNK